MKIATDMKQGVLVISLAGEFDLHSVKEFRQVFEDAAEKKGVQKVLLDFQKVSFIDSSGIGIILGRYKQLKAGGGKIALVNLAGGARHVFELSGVLKLIKAYHSTEEALAEI